MHRAVLLDTIRRRITALQWTRAAILFPLAGLTVLSLLSFVASENGLAGRSVVMGMLVLATCRPHDALLICAGLVPIAGSGALLGTSAGLAEALVLAFLGGWLLYEALRSSQTDPVNLALPSSVLLLSGAVVASCAVQMVVLWASTGDFGALFRQAWHFLTADYFPEPRLFPAVTASALILEGMGLYVSVMALCRRDASLGPRVARMVAVCAAGVGALNLNRLLTVSLRSGISLRELAVSSDPVRISVAFPDVNAAGSYFAMTLLLSGALAFEGRRARAGWIVVMCLILGALWLTGSRTAFVAVATAGALIVAATATLRRRTAARLAVAVMLVLVVFAAVQVSKSPQRPLSVAASIRVELARTGLRMFAANPLFGVGVGRYYAVSGEFSSPQLLRTFPRENAHNNFLQILAELGIVGFGAFAWLLLAVGRRVWRALTEGGLSPLALGAAAGLVAFLLTCLAGHPLLIREVAYAFWLVLGLAAVLVPAVPPTASAMQARGSWPLRSVVAGGVAVLLIVSVPLRARQMIAEANMGNASVGLSDWQTDSEGTSFRWMDEYAQFSIRANARVVRLPLRLSARQEGVAREVEIYVDGLLLARIELEGSEWHEFRVAMPPAPLGIDFRRIELRARRNEAATPGRAGAAAPPRIEVGRPNLTRPAG